MGRTAKEATIVCYLQHFGPPGRYRRPRNQRMMLFKAFWIPREISEATNTCYLHHFVTQGIGRTAKEATNAYYLQHFGSSGKYRIKEATNACYLQYFGPRRKYRRPRLYAIYSTLGPQGGIGGHDCMLFTTRWAPREVSEATIVCYLRHFGPSRR